MRTKRVFGLLLVILAGRLVLPQTTRVSEKGAGFRSKAIIAVLPGNPFDSRLYSLQRNVLTQTFVSRLLREHSITAPASAGPLVHYQPESSFEVTFENADAQKAVAVVKATMDALMQEMEKRRSLDSTYGSARIQSPARFDTSEGRPRAEGVIVMDGVRWSQAEKRETEAQYAAVIGALSDIETLRTVAKQGSSDVDVKQVRSSISFRRMNDSWIEVTLAAPDPNFLQRLLDTVPKGRVDLTGRTPLADLDFVPKYMRNGWYIFNCCQTGPL